MAKAAEQVPERHPLRMEAGAVTAVLDRQARVADRLAALSGDPPQSLVLESADQNARMAMALYWACLLNCSGRVSGRACLDCPECRQILDIVFNDLIVFPLPGEDQVRVAHVRDMRPTWGQPPRGSGVRATVFAEANRLRPDAANTLLKTLEEPRPGNVFVLVTPQRSRLLPTLVSRSFVLTLSHHGVPGADPAVREWALALAGYWTTGRDWFHRTQAKGAVDADLARAVVLELKRGLADALSGRSGSGTNDLGGRMVGLSPKARRTVGLALELADDALDPARTSTVSPALVLDWLATRLS